MKADIKLALQIIGNGIAKNCPDWPDPLIDFDGETIGELIDCIYEQDGWAVYNAASLREESLLLWFEQPIIVKKTVAGLVFSDENMTPIIVMDYIEGAGSRSFWGHAMKTDRCYQRCYRCDREFDPDVENFRYLRKIADISLTEIVCSNCIKPKEKESLPKYKGEIRVQYIPPQPLGVNLADSDTFRDGKECTIAEMCREINHRPFYAWSPTRRQKIWYFIRTPYDWVKNKILDWAKDEN